MNTGYRYQLERKHLTGINGIDYNVSSRLESYPPNTDLCDVLLNG